MFRLKPHAARLSLLLLLLLFAAAGTARAQQQQSPPPPDPKDIPNGLPAVESGRFRLHKFEQPIGLESYTVTREGDSLVVRSPFEFTDRGPKDPLTATPRA